MHRCYLKAFWWQKPWEKRISKFKCWREIAWNRVLAPDLSKPCLYRNISVIFSDSYLACCVCGYLQYFYYHLYTRPDLNEDTNLASTIEVITYSRKPTGNLMVRWWRSCWPQWSPQSQSCCVRVNFVTKKMMMLYT